MAQGVDPSSDAPDAVAVPASEHIEAARYPEAFGRWRGPEDVNAWIGARFRYDSTRAPCSSRKRSGKRMAACRSSRPSPRESYERTLRTRAARQPHEAASPKAADP